MTAIKNACSGFAVTLLLAAIAFAQGSASGDLHVVVKDAAGKVVTNATVNAVEQGKAVTRSTSLNADGEYRILALAPGRYTVTVTAPGFSKAVYQDQAITVGGMAELPVTLQVSGGETVVNVSAESELVETTRTSSTDTVDQRRIDSLPINGRNYINFTLTDSQVVRDNAPSIGAAPTSGLNMSGQRARSNLVNVDGADAVDNSVNGVRSTVSQEAVQEFQIITNSYAAEYGRASGGVVNIITRSGSNDFHGTVFGYARNRNFQAVNPFSTVSNPAYTRVQAGAAFGGPIKKDKTYYYFAYETTRRHETGFSSIGQNNFGLVPFDATNIFAPGLAPPGTFMIQVTPEQAAFLQTPGLPPALLQPYAFLAGASSGIALNGSYPASYALLGPLVPGGLKQFPTSCLVNPSDPAASNLTCNGLPSGFLPLVAQSGNFPVFEGTSLYSLRLDHNVTNANRLMLRGNVSPSTVTGIEVNGQNQTFGQNGFSRTSEQTYRDAAGTAQDTWTLGSNKINEFRFQYARRGLLYNFANAPGGSNLGVNIPGVAFVGREPFTFIKRTEQRYQVTDNFSWSIGKHDTKFGVDFNYIPVTADFTVNYGGVIDFGALSATQLGLPDLTAAPFNLPFTFPGFSPVQAYGAGLPSTYIQGIGNPHDSFVNKPLGLFWQDSWKMRSNLTLNYGVRYDVEFVPKFPAPTGLAGPAYNALGLQKGIQTDKNNFAPRIGIAWDPRSDGKTVVRASYGMFYDHPLLGLFFLGDASDGSKTGQLLFVGGSPCNSGNPGGVSPLNLNATNIFQGILGVNNCLPPGAAQASGYLPGQQRFDAFFPNSLFINQNYLQAGFPLAFQPFGFPQAKNFVYAYSHQANLTVEQDLGKGYDLSLSYNFNGGRHLNRPINANPARGDLLLQNWRTAIDAGAASLTTDPRFVTGCGVDLNPGPFFGQPFVPAALMNFFRPSGFNPSIASALLGSPLTAPCVTQIAPLVLAADHLSTACDPTTPAFTGCVPFSDMAANFSNGSSVYHALTANLRKRFGQHYEFLASYTWSHAIDDSTDLQSPLSPQDSFHPELERSNSTFDQRHRFVFSGVYQTGHVGGSSFASKLASDWTFAPIIEVSSGRPFNIGTGDDTGFQFAPLDARPNVVPAGTPANSCNFPTVPSKFSPTGFLQEPCFIDGGLFGNLGRNAGLKPYTLFNDLRIARRIRMGERLSLDGIVDIFNIANRFNVADVNPLFTQAGQPTAAYDPRQLQFALKLNW
ncbi:MAG TPA: carboxypeptidase regulatory-like domain-containing protein [Terriglobales bacterium]|nr:carboxypeptidase regulatory-like domain-containing protein [Terriglobales bacterium]